MSESDQRQWHRLFGIALTDLFTGTPWRVELEMELALQSRLLDVLIIERVEGSVAFEYRPPNPRRLPDGLEGLRAYNLMTYKSLREPLDAWAVEELIGHYVDYRKLNPLPCTPNAVEPGQDNPNPPSKKPRLRPEEDFTLYAVATRYPSKLLRQVGPASLAATAWPGVFDLTWGARVIRLIVLNRIAKEAHNAPWELFSAKLDRIRHGIEHYQAQREALFSLLHTLYFAYRLEVPKMAYTMQDFLRDSYQQIAEQLGESERQAFLQRMSVEDRLRGLAPEERLRGLAPEDRLRGLDEQELARLRDALEKRY